MVLYTGTMIQNPSVRAIILMGGSGERFGSTIPKQFHRLAGKKVYLHTVETFLSAGLFEGIILVCPPLWLEQIRKDLAPYPSTLITLVEGGASRQESSFNGLLSCPSNTHIVVIHDAVRPFVTCDLLKQNIEAALKFRAVDTCIPSADTLVYAPGHTGIADIPKRSDYLRGQTPQSFSWPLILQAHHEARARCIADSSDDCSLVLHLGHPVHIIFGSEENLKITSELDLFLAEQILRMKNIPSTLLQHEQALLGKRIAITGGTGGIGSSLSRLLQEEGAVPISVARTSEKYPADLTSYPAARDIFNKILNDHGPLDGLVNSIGHLKVGELDQLPAHEIDRLISANLTGVIYSCKCVHLKKGAHIVNIASSSYARGRKNCAIYAGAKAAVVNFTQGLAEEREDLFINAVVPQRTLTAMRTDNFPDEHPSTLLTPEEVAKEIVTLLKQSSLTGTIVEVRKKYPANDSGIGT